MSGEWLGMGTPGWLSDRTRRQIEVESAREQAQAAREQRERESHRDELHQRAQMLYKQQAEQRGEDVSAVELAGGFGGRTIGDVLSEAASWADREDARAAARARREAENPQPVHIEFGEPVIHDASPARRALLNRSRHWQEWRARKAQAEAARRALENDNTITLAEPITLKDKYQ